MLKRNGVLTSPEERSLLVSVAGLQAPPPGITVTLSIETQHGDSDAGGSEADRIAVWRQSMWVENSISAEVDTPVVFPVVFEARILDGDRPVPTPSDYFRLAISAGSGERPAFRFEQDFAFLMENQWTATLPPLLEETDGAAPDELVVYYSDMFPFERDANDPVTRLQPALFDRL